MSGRLVHLSDMSERKISLRNFMQANAEDNSPQRRMIMDNVMRAIKTELTEKQRIVFLRYYGQQEKIPAIAADMGLNKSTVARHLKVARNRMQRIFSYTMIPLNVEDDLRSE